VRREHFLGSGQPLFGQALPQRLSVWQGCSQSGAAAGPQIIHEGAQVSAAAACAARARAPGYIARIAQFLGPLMVHGVKGGAISARHATC
jgi:hypothetical protein